MKARLSQPEHTIQVEENVWIPAKDGTRLSATIFRPESADRFPVIFRCDGYRKDRTRKRGLRRMGRWFASRGYVYVLMDIRGTGNSEGIALDEYTPQELEDACDAIRWLGTRPWSNGAVGMWGKSYSGFNSIQTAMLRPPHLKAILPIYATDDRYTDDMHYWGGMRLVAETIPYPLKMIYTNPLPPNPAFLPDTWRELWRKRIEQSPPWFLEWWRQQVDGPYWRHGSLRPNYETIDVPVFMVGGWRDGYTSSIPRMLTNLKAPCKALIGPWGHELPHIATLGTQLDFLGMMLRWWDHWLKGLDTGLMDEAPILYFLQDYHRPGWTKATDGEWRTLAEWPDPSESKAVFYFGPDGHLATSRPDRSGRDSLPWSLRLGVGEWKWCLHGPGSLPGDQRAAETYGLTYSTEPLEKPLELLGQSRLSLTVSASQPVAQILARLCDVAPTGESTLVSWGALNLTHRDSHFRPTPLEPGQPYRVTVEFSTVSWRFRPGHQLRIVLNNHDWPRAWPAPWPFDLEVHHDSERPAELSLPLAPAHTGAAIKPDPPPEHTPDEDVEATSSPYQWQLIQERPSGNLRFTLSQEESIRMRDGSQAENTSRRVELAVPEDDPVGNVLTAHGETTLCWPEVEATVKADLKVTSTPETFEFQLELAVLANGQPFGHKQWRELIPRQLV